MIREAVDYVLTADATGLLSATAKSEKALRDVGTEGAKTQQTIHESTRTLTDRVEQTGSKLTGVGKALTVGLAIPAVAAFGAMGQAAAEDAESQEVLAHNLTQMAGASDDAIAGSEDYITQLEMMSGVADDDLRPALSKLASATGDVGEAQDLLAVALDTSVARGKPLETVSQALARAYQGNTGALGRLGVATKDAQGNALSFSEILAQLKTQTEGAAQAAGETGAGAWRRAKVAFQETKESIGAALLPAISTLAGVATSVLDWFTKLGPAGTTAATGIGILAIALGPIATAVGKIMQNASSIIGWIKNLGGAAQGASGFFSGLWDKIGGVAGLLKGAGIAALIAGIGIALEQALTATSRFRAQWAETFQHATEGPSSLLDVSQQLRDRWVELSRQNSVRQFWSYWFGDMKGVVSEMERVNEGLGQTDEVIGQVAHTTGAGTYQIRMLADALKLDLSSGSDEVRTRLQIAARAILDAGGNLDTFVNGSDRAKQSLLDIAKGSAGASEAFGDIGDAADEATDPVEALSQALSGLLDPMVGYDEAKARFEEINQRLFDLTHDATITGERRKREGEAIARDLVKAYEQEMEALARLGGSQENARAVQTRYRDELRQLGVQIPELGSKTADYANQIARTPRSIFTSFGASAPVGFVQAWKNLINSVPTKYKTTFQAASVGAQVATAILGVPHRASGGSFNPGEWSWVGEEGPELVHFGASGYVHDAEASKQIAASRPGTVVAAPRGSDGAVGGATVVNVSVNVAGSVLTDVPDGLVAAVEDGLARALRRQGSLAFQR